MWDARRIDAQPWRLQDERDLDTLYALIVNPGRNLPVYLLTQPDSLQLGIGVDEFLLDADYLAKRMQGLGFVVTVPRNLTWGWTERVGKTWSAFRGATRTYRPGLDFDRDPLSHHPLAFPERILAFEHGGKKAERGFEEFLIEQAHRAAATRGLQWAPCVFYTDALQRAAEQERLAAGEDADWKGIYEQEIEAWKEQMKIAEGLIESHEEDARELRAQLEEARAEAQAIRSYAEGLRYKLEEATGKSSDATDELPTTYDAMADWVSRRLAGRLILHPRAVKSLKSAAYEDVELVARALLLLAREYRDMRLKADGGGEMERWEKGFADLGLRFGGSITETRAGEEGDEYFVRYPIGSQRREFLKFHLRKGDAKDDRYCLGIYFFWDSDREIVVVGDLPRHLNTRAT